MAKSSNKKSIEDLENQLLLKNKNLNEKYLEIETLLDLTNTINSLDDLETLFFNVLTLSSSIINSSKGVILLKNEVSNIFDVFSEFNLEDTQVKKQIFNTRSGFLKKLNKEKKGFVIKSDDDFNHNLFNSKYSLVSPILNNNKLVGAIVLFDKETRDGLINFKASDLKLIESISIQTSFAYQNVKLLESLKNLINSMKILCHQLPQV